MGQAVEQLYNDMSSAERFEESIRNEINYFSCCLDEIRLSDDMEYKALTPIYESLLAHRRRQLDRVTAQQVSKAV